MQTRFSLTYNHLQLLFLKRNESREDVYCPIRYSQFDVGIVTMIDHFVGIEYN